MSTVSVIRSIRRTCMKCGGDFNDAIVKLPTDGKIRIVKCEHCDFRTYVRTAKVS